VIEECFDLINTFIHAFIHDLITLIVILDFSNLGGAAFSDSGDFSIVASILLMRVHN